MPTITAKAASITIELRLPPRELSPNARVHYMAKARAARKYRELAKWSAFGACGFKAPRWREATAQATFYFRDRRARDRDNLLSSLKNAFDGFADAGVVVNDAGITHLPVVIAVDKARPRVEILVQESGR